MRDRAEKTVVYATLLVTIASLAIGILLVSPLFYVGAVGAVLMWGYSIYWALNLRRLLSAQVYRNQALGAGLIALGWAAFNASTFLVSGPADLNNVGIAGNVSISLLLFSLLLTFYWIDSSILAARKSDPLYRNSLHWREVRLALWPIVAGACVAFEVILLTDLSLFLTPSGGVTPLFVALLAIAILGVFGPGLVMLPVVGRRSRDQVMRRNLEWFGLFAATLVVAFPLTLLSSVTVSYVIMTVAFVIGSYCVYRGAKSLAPINRLPEPSPARPPG